MTISRANHHLIIHFPSRAREDNRVGPDRPTEPETNTTNLRVARLPIVGIPGPSDREHLNRYWMERRPGCRDPSLVYFFIGL